MGHPRPEVALHGVEAASLERCALIRDWLDDLGVDRATLLVRPSPGLHPLDPRSSRLTGWLEERRVAGDAIAEDSPATSPGRIDLYPDLGGRRVRAVERRLARAGARPAVNAV